MKKLAERTAKQGSNGAGTIAREPELHERSRKTATERWSSPDASSAWSNLAPAQPLRALAQCFSRSPWGANYRSSITAE